MAVNGKAPPVAELIEAHPPRRVAGEQGDEQLALPIRLRLSRSGAEGELDLGREALFYPSDVAIDGWIKSAQDGRAEVVYE